MEQNPELLDLSFNNPSCQQVWGLVPSGPGNGFGYAIVTKTGDPMLCELDQCHLLNISSKSWDKVDLQPLIHRYGTTSVSTGSNQYWITGGHTVCGNSSSDCLILQTEVFNGESGEFRMGPDLPLPLSRHCIVRINQTHVFIGNYNAHIQTFHQVRIAAQQAT